jgi:hypothetical protein
VLVSIKSNKVSINFVASGELGFVIRFERENIELTVSDTDRAGVLGRDVKVLGDLAGSNVNDSYLVFGRKRNVGFLIAGKGDSNGLIKISGALLEINILHGVDDAEMRRALAIGVDDAYRIGNVIANPDFKPIGSDCNAYGIDTHRNTSEKVVCRGLKYVDRVGRGIGDEEAILMNDNRLKVRTQKGRVANFSRRRSRPIIGNIFLVAGWKKPNAEKRKDDKGESCEKPFHKVKRV